MVEHQKAEEDLEAKWLKTQSIMILRGVQNLFRAFWISDVGLRDTFPCCTIDHSE